MSMSPSVMGIEGQAAATLSPGGGSDSAEWPRHHHHLSRAREPQRQVQRQHSPQRRHLHQDPAPDPPGATSLGPHFRLNADSGGSFLADAPDAADARRLGPSALGLDPAAVPPPPIPIPRDHGSSSQQASPMAFLGGSAGGGRRQGVVFGDSFGESGDSTASSTPPPVPPRLYQHQNQHQPQRQASGTIRPRTRTIDAAMLTQRATPPVPDRQRHRVGSVSLSGSQPVLDEQRPTPTALTIPDSMGYSSMPTGRFPEPSTPSTPSARSRDRKSSSNKRLMKRLSSRPASPAPAPAASIDSLPAPIATGEPARVISLMKTLHGKMRGEIEYQADAEGAWHTGYAYIDGETGHLMCDCGPDDEKSSFAPLISDLRGCRVLPVEYPESGKACVELVATSQQHSQQQHPRESPILLLRPISSDDWSLWLAALLCWQQVRPVGSRMAGSQSVSTPVAPVRPGLRRQGQSNSSDSARGSNIIKVGTVMLWDKGPAATPLDIFQRASSRNRRSSPAAAWRTVSCILHEDGEFKLLMENDILALCVIQLSQLSRHAIQQLDRTVLDEDFCIALFPIYASSASRLSLFRPIYLALDSRVSFEVWFVLLRAFAVPDIYKLGGPDDEAIQEVADLEQEQAEETFRIERTVVIRVTEARMGARLAASAAAGGGEAGAPEGPVHDRVARSEQDSLVGNYLAEVILDGEVRARTATRVATKNPFWREDCEFVDLPPSARELSIVLKRVPEGDGASPEATARKSSASSGGGHEEVVCGTVSVVLNQLERGKDHEKWLHIVDDRLQPIGTMLVKVSHAEHIALLAKEYEPLSELLHRSPAGLTTAISAALPGQLRRLSDVFLDIFQASGSAGDWLMALVEDEIDGIGSQTSLKKFRFGSRLHSGESESSTATDRELIVRDMSRSLAGEANLLFRGNTLLTQSLEFHMRRLGAEYLAEVLRDKMVELAELNPDCEVDPSKLPHHTGTAELDQRWSRLVALTTQVWTCIADSADRLPAELRHILKYIRAVAEDRYGDFLRPVTYTAVSGFLFLRFICPAILSPKLFGLLRDHPQPRAQRTLTLITKVLQKLSNMGLFGKREEWMEPMNKFLVAQRPVFRDYIDGVCGIPAEREGIKSVPASYSTPITMLGRLGPTAREGFPSLPYLIDQARSFASLVKLWADSCPPDAVGGEQGSDKELVAFDDVCRGLQKRADACLAKVERVRAAGASSRGTGQLAESVEQATLIECLSSPSAGLPSVAVDTDRRPGSSGSDGPGDDAAARPRSKECRGRRDGSGPDGRKTGAGGTVRARNGKVGRTILSGIMRIGGRAESPDSKHAR